MTTLVAEPATLERLELLRAEVQQQIYLASTDVRERWFELERRGATLDRHRKRLARANARTAGEVQALVDDLDGAHEEIRRTLQERHPLSRKLPPPSARGPVEHPRLPEGSR